MFTSEPIELTDLSRVFLDPANSTHRQYEALRASFVDHPGGPEVARRFGYTPGSFRVLVHQFRQDPRRSFFLTPAKGPQSAPKADPLRELIIALRKQNLSIYDISRNLTHQGHSLSPVAVAQVLKDEGFARLPRRADDERPPGTHPTTAEVADVRQLDLNPRAFSTPFGGLFLFLPILAAIPLDRILRAAGCPGSEMIPWGCALRSLLALKLFGTARHRHVMSAVLDQGLALFAGLNVIPKRSFLTEYSCRIDPAGYPELMRRWFDAVSVSDGCRRRNFHGEVGPTCDTHVSHSRRPKRPQLYGVGRLGRRERAPWGWVRLAVKVEPFLTETDTVSRLGLPRGHSFDLDFHTIPFHGEDALIEKHCVSQRSRRQKGILAFVAQDADTRAFCYANGELRKDEPNDEILRFVRFWKDRTGRHPQELIFDSQLTTYANLNELNRLKIDFITLRRRTPGLKRTIDRLPASAWRRIELKGVSRQYTHPRILDQRTALSGYDGPVRQVVVTDLGHEDPTILLTNQMTRSMAKLVERYAQRMIIENTIADGIDFFHMDALSSAVAMKVNCDLPLTLMASSLYRLLAGRIGRGYERAESRHLFQDFVTATADVTISESEIVVRYQKRAHNPLLIAAGFDTTETAIPWLGRKRLRLVVG